MNRSPSHPAIALPAAEALARRLYEQARFAFASVDTVVETWSYTPKSSMGLRALSALMQFGLIEARGTRSAREVRLTELGKRVVLGGGASDRVYRRALIEAALRPRVHATTWERFDGRLPDDAELSRHLVLEHSFNPDTVARFVSLLRETLTYAGLGDAATVQQNGIPASSGGGATGDRAPRVTLRLPLPGGREASLSVPGALSPEEHDLVRAFVEVNLRSMRPALDPR